MLIPLSNLDVLYYFMLVCFNKHPVTKCDPEVACIDDGFWRREWISIPIVCSDRHLEFLVLARPNSPSLQRIQNGGA